MERKLHVAIKGAVVTMLDQFNRIVAVRGECLVSGGHEGLHDPPGCDVEPEPTRSVSITFGSGGPLVSMILTADEAESIAVALLSAARQARIDANTQPVKLPEVPR